MYEIVHSAQNYATTIHRSISWCVKFADYFHATVSFNLSSMLWAFSHTIILLYIYAETELAIIQYVMTFEYLNTMSSRKFLITMIIRFPWETKKKIMYLCLQPCTGYVRHIRLRESAWNESCLRWLYIARPPPQSSWCFILGPVLALLHIASVAVASGSLGTSKHTCIQRKVSQYYTHIPHSALYNGRKKEREKYSERKPEIGTLAGKRAKTPSGEKPDPLYIAVWISPIL